MHMKIATPKHYARALHETCKSGEALEKMIAELAMIRDRLHEAPTLRRFFSAGGASFVEKQDALRDLFKDMLGERTYNFLFLIIEAEMVDRLEDIIDDARRLLYQQEGVFDIEVTTRSPLSEKQEKEIVMTLTKKTNKKIVIHSNVDPDIVGGMVVRIGDTLLDGSLRGKLKRLQTQISSFN